MTQDRLARILPDEASDAQAAVMARLGAGRGRIPTPFNIWLHNPSLAGGMEIIGTHIDSTPTLSEAELEVAILSTAVFWNAPYVITNHRKKALKSGLPEAVVDSILARRRPEPIEGRLGIVCNTVFELLEGGMVGDAGFDRIASELGRAALAELLVVIGYFTSVSLAMNLHAMRPKS